MMVVMEGWRLGPKAIALAGIALVVVLLALNRGPAVEDPYLWFADERVEDVPTVRMESGVPKVDYGGATGVRDNPVTVAQWGLSNYSRGDVGPLFTAADWLVDHQRPDGTWAYDFDWRVASADDSLKAPWISGLAQGQALSVLARAHRLTGDERYLVTGRAALRPYSLPVEDGGVVRQWTGLPFYEEYPTARPSLVLNGILFQLVGLHEWADETGDLDAESLWAAGEATAAQVIERYDLGAGGGSAYAGAFLEPGGPEPIPIAGSVYEPIHPALAEEMHRLTGRPVYAEMAQRWAVPGLPWGWIVVLLTAAGAVGWLLWRVRSGADELRGDLGVADAPGGDAVPVRGVVQVEVGPGGHDHAVDVREQ